MAPWIHEPKNFESFERINSIRETNGNFDSCNSCKWLVLSSLHELRESKFPFAPRIGLIRSNFFLFFAHVSGVNGGFNEAQCIDASLLCKPVAAVAVAAYCNRWRLATPLIKSLTTACKCSRLKSKNIQLMLITTHLTT